MQSNLCLFVLPLVQHIFQTQIYSKVCEVKSVRHYYDNWSVSALLILSDLHMIEAVTVKNYYSILIAKCVICIIKIHQDVQKIKMFPPKQQVPFMLLFIK